MALTSLPRSSGTPALTIIRRDRERKTRKRLRGERDGSIYRAPRITGGNTILFGIIVDSGGGREGFFLSFQSFF